MVRTRDRQLLLLGGATALLSAGLWFAFPPRLVHAPEAVAVWVLAVLVLYVMAEAWPLSVEYRGETFGFTLNGVPLALGLAFVGPLGTVVGRVVGTGGALGLYYRQAPLKMLVNLAGMVLEVWVAAHVYAAVAGRATGSGAPLAWVGIGLAVMAADVVTGSNVLGAIRLSVGRLEPGTWRAVGIGMLINFAVGIPLAILTVIAVSVDARTALVLLPVAALLIRITRERHVLATKLGTTQQLYRFISDLAEPATTAQALERVLERAMAVTGATRASIILLGDDAASCWTTTADGVEGEPLPPRAVERLMGEVGDGLLITAAQPRARRYARLLPEGAEQVLVTRLAQADVRGLLVLADRAGNLALFDDDDLQVAVAIGGHAATAIAEARLLERLQAEVDERHRMALTDGQTGLPNRDGLLARVPALGDGAVLLVEIRDLTEFEAGFGHAVAEGIVLAVGDRIATCTRVDRRTTMARLSTGRYAVVLPGASGPADATRWARQVVEAANGPVEQGDLSIDVGVRVGIAAAPSHGTDVNELLRAADRGLGDAAAEQRQVGWFDSQRDRDTTRRLELAGELRTALEEGHLRLAYQPKVDLATGRVIGMEALARWPHAERGFIRPEEFIDVAERTGLIRPLTLWAVRTSLRQAAAWRAEGRPFTMAVNLSNAALLDADVVREIVSIVDDAGVPADCVVLEITESLVMGDVQRGGGALSIFAAAGIPVSIDDFGTGYSSLAHLKTLPVAELKIDRAFVTDLASDKTDEALCQAIIGMARQLGLTVVGEGIEDVTALRMLRDMGCHVGQGHYLARAVPASQLPAVVAEIEGRLVERSVARLDDRARRQR